MSRIPTSAIGLILSMAGVTAAAAQPSCPHGVLTGAAALESGWRQDAPQVCRHVTVADLPAPTQGRGNPASQIDRPAEAMPSAPPGFTVSRAYADTEAPRLLHVAPNGDLFVSESESGQVRVLRPDGHGGFSADSVFARGLDYPFGVAFYPSQSANPTFVYVGTPGKIVRYPYHNGDLAAAGAAQVVVASLPRGGNHISRDLAFVQSDHVMLVGVGSASNDAENGEMQAGVERLRATVLSATPEGGDLAVYVSGIRNPAALAVEPGSGSVWATVNERDLLGDNLVPDYLTHVVPGAFYGWPWYYLGGHVDPRHTGDAVKAGPVTVPDLLFVAHSAPLGLTFAAAGAIPGYEHGAFVAMHGSWNRLNRNEGKVVFVAANPDGTPSAIYQDVLTGFTVAAPDTPDGTASWGRPVGVAIGSDHALYVSDDWSDSIWRVVRSSE